MNTLFVIIGPTGIGKTNLSILIAKKLGSSIISCDSRQLFREMSIGTAAPDAHELSEIRHYFIGTKSIREQYSAGQYEIDAIPVILKELEKTGNTVMVGGSMLYVDAICRGIDDIPTTDPTIRKEVRQFFEKNGIEAVRRELKLLDPKHYMEVDLKNTQRLLHALEVCIQTGKTFTELRTHNIKKRNFNIIKIGLELPREEMYDRINRRVLAMMDNGLEQEARNLYPFRQLNALNTVGYKEMFMYFDGDWTRDQAIEKIQTNTRRYAKKQMTWFKNDKGIVWFNPHNEHDILEFVASKM